MNRKTATVGIMWCAVLMWVSVVSWDSSVAYGAVNDWDSQARLLSALDLPRDASNADIMELFDVPSKRPLVITLIRYRKITSASDRLLQVVNDKGVILPVRISAAKALNTLGNKQWVELLRSLVADPNSSMYAGCKLSIAALLANEGDPSQLKILTDFVNSTKWFNRAEAVREMGRVSGKNSADAENIVETLVFIAKNDSDPRVRWNAVNALDRIATKRRDFAPKLIEAAEANTNSSDEGLRSTCKIAIFVWQPRLMTDEEVVDLLEKKGLSTTVHRQIHERKLQAAVPALLEMVRGRNSIQRKLIAVNVLTFLGDRSWLSDMKQFAIDPNAGATLAERITIAGTLANLGDYSQFKLVVDNLSHEADRVQRKAVDSLASFGNAPDPIGLQTAELLETVAATNPKTSRRATAIEHLEEMAEDRPEIVPYVIRALEANLSTNGGSFTTMCKTKLKKYQEPPNQQ